MISVVVIIHLGPGQRKYFAKKIFRGPRFSQVRESKIEQNARGAFNYSFCSCAARTSSRSLFVRCSYYRELNREVRDARLVGANLDFSQQATSKGQGPFQNDEERQAAHGRLREQHRNLWRLTVPQPAQVSVRMYDN